VLRQIEFHLLPPRLQGFGSFLRRGGRFRPHLREHFKGLRLAVKTLALYSNSEIRPPIHTDPRARLRRCDRLPTG